MSNSGSHFVEWVSVPSHSVPPDSFIILCVGFGGSFDVESVGYYSDKDTTHDNSQALNNLSDLIEI